MRWQLSIRREKLALWSVNGFYKSDDNALNEAGRGR
jgi:hypothetical protein